MSGLLGHEPQLDAFEAAATPLLFDLAADTGEHTNVADANAAVVANMTARLAAAGATGPPPAIVQHGNKTVDAFFCSQARETGYLEPVDWRAPWPTPAPAPPSPAPAPAPPSPPGTLCAAGIRNGDCCCAASCGICGGPDCGKHPGGGAHCCVGKIKDNGKVCVGPDDVGCVLPKATLLAP